MKSLIQLYQEHQGKVSDKWSIYISEYDRIFSNYRNFPVNVLEIGVQNGGSLEIWGEYFGRAENLIGCDINIDCLKLTYDDSRIQVVVGDANEKSTEADVISRAENFDIIIDDGSHKSSDIVKSFAIYFRHLKEGGVFVIEDLHCSYWEDFEGGIYHPYSSISFFKRLVDIINHEHFGVEKQRVDLIRGFCNEYHVNFEESDLEKIHSIEFFNSVCVVRKKIPQLNVLGERFIAGRIEAVVSGHHEVQVKSTAQPQLNNEWSTLVTAPDESFLNLVKTLAEQEVQLNDLNIISRQKDENILAIGKLMNEKVNGLEKTIVEKYKVIENLTGKVAEIDKQFSNTVDELKNIKLVVAERDGQVGDQQEKLVQKDAQITAIYESNSWKFTKPLRMISNQAKRAKRLLKILPILVKRGGGLESTFKKALGVYRREGLAGVKRVLRSGVRSGPDALNSEVGEYDPKGYSEWIRRYDNLTDNDRNKMRTIQAGFKRKPLISVLMPTFNTKSEWLIEAIESVRNQIYGNWELCIADDASTNSDIREILEKYAREDSRIKIVIRSENGHISASSNSALALATGQWVALLDHDDLLSENALFWVVECINRSPEARLIYSDEDKISENGQRFDPYFKSDWNLDLFRSHNMICHLGVYQMDLIQKVGGFRLGFEGSQDYDLALRCSELLRADQILHISRVLYHWRAHIESTALSTESKPYAIDAGERALNEHLGRCGVAGKVQFSAHGYMPIYQLPAELPLVSIVIPTRNGLSLLAQCIKSIIEKTTYKNYEIIIVDNGSDQPETLNYLEDIVKTPNIKVIRDDSPFNYSRLNNRAVQLASGEIIALVNNDIEVISPEWLSVMVSHALRPEVGAVGAKLFYSNNSLQHGGVIIGLGGVAGHSHKHFPKGSLGYACRLSLTQNLSAVTAACLVIRKNIFLEVNGLDEDNLVIAFNDVDFCLRVRDAGYLNVWTPLAELYHHESATRGFEDTPEKKERFSREVSYMQKRWGAQLLCDPAYSANLTLDYEDFSYAWPPRVSSIDSHENLKSERHID